MALKGIAVSTTRDSVMLRAIAVLLGVAALLTLDAQEAWADAAADAAAAASAWPPFGDFHRGTGYYFSIWKIGFCWGLFACWVGTTDWLSRDCLRMNLHYVLWNSVAVGTFAAFFVLLWLIPWFWLGYFFLLASYIAPLTTYIVLRNKKVQYHERVLTPAHLRRWFSAQAARLGIKVASEALTADQLGPDIKFTAQGAGSERDDKVNLLKARQSPGYMKARVLFHAALERRAHEHLARLWPKADDSEAPDRRHVDRVRPARSDSSPIRRSRRISSRRTPRWKC